MSTGQDFLSCPASYLRPGWRQDRTNIKNASCPTGQDRTPGPPVLCSALVRMLKRLTEDGDRCSSRQATH